jgi:hypothetical protein
MIRMTAAMTVRTPLRVGAMIEGRYPDRYGL